jgi:hypothetical protein
MPYADNGNVRIHYEMGLSYYPDVSTKRGAVDQNRHAERSVRNVNTATLRAAKALVKDFC